MAEQSDEKEEESSAIKEVEKGGDDADGKASADTKEAATDAEETEEKKEKTDAEKAADIFFFSIDNSPEEDLNHLAQEYNIPRTEAGLKQDILNFFKIAKTATKADREKAEEGKNFRIVSAQTIECKKVNDKDFIYIDGGVKIEFDLGGVTRTLDADSILFDVEEKEILAFGHILITGSGSDDQLKDLTAEMFFLNFNNNKIRMTEAVGSTIKETGAGSSNYYMKGKTIIIDNRENEMYFDNGSLMPAKTMESSNWKITANKIIMKNNGDVFLSNLLLNMGRVPVLPLPIILYLPGSPFTINPAIGFASDKGAFINTTYEIYGKSPLLGKAGGEENSLTNLFKSGSVGDIKKKGFLYKYENSSDKEKKKNNDSYMAAFFDIYQKEGFFLGLDTDNKLWKNKIALKGNAGIVYKPLFKPTTFQEDTYKKFRYYADIEKISVSNLFGFNLSAQVPFYSDPGIYKTYRNRLTAFNLASLFGKSQKFPEEFTGEYNEQDMRAKADFSLPSILSTKYLSSLSISASVQHSRYWKQENIEKYYKYYSNTSTVPSVTANMSGTILSLRKKASNNREIKKVAQKITEGLPDNKRREQELRILKNTGQTKKRPNKPEITESTFKAEGEDEEETEMVQEQEQAELTETEITAETKTDEEIKEKENKTEEDKTEKEQEEKAEAEVKGITDELEDVLARNEEAEEKRKKEQAKQIAEYKKYDVKANLKDETDTDFMDLLFTGSFLTLKYSFSDTYLRKFAAPEELAKKRGKKTEENALNGRVNLDFGIGNGYFTVSDVLTPNYVYSFSEESGNLKKKEFTLKSDTTASLSVPTKYVALSLNYNLGLLLYSMKSTEDENSPEDKTEEKIEWNKDFVYSHSVGGSLSLFSNILKASLSLSLPPMEVYTLSPSLSFSYKKIGLSATHTMEGDSYKELKSTKTTGSFSLSGSLFRFSLNASYIFDKKDKGDFFLVPFEISGSSSLNLFSGWLSLSANASYYGVNSSDEFNYFSSIAATLSVKSYLSSSVSWSGVYDELKMDRVTVRSDGLDFKIPFWKNRIILGLGLKPEMSFNFKDVFQNSIDYTVKFGFEIKEFIVIDFFLKGANKNFLKYTGNDRNGKFNFGSFFTDLLRGINVFGRDSASSNFKLDTLSVSVTHDMKDWILQFIYDGKFELNGNEYEWKPKYTILLKWSVIPELKIEKEFNPNNNNNSNI